ncbi:hypothetical protein BOX15_Mlig025746g1 [Macrostomum lignano]|uniref:RHD domain-containing protein n=1 Tax=Macrostomum lignano TaxID=282301 RepID=A0A267F265_9PLAT|nr:hypothetical protein BOX15_Mlig025746g1 [Macrostomum lignano]
MYVSVSLKQVTAVLPVASTAKNELRRKLHQIHVTMQQLQIHSPALGQQQLAGGYAKHLLSYEPDRNPMIAATSTQALLNEIEASEVEYCEYSGSVTASDETQVIGGDILLQAEPQLLSLKEPQPPSLTIEEQPARFYRFRYESEIEKDSSRVGGLLLGRSSTDGNKSFVRVRVSSIDQAVHSQLQLTVCTVSAEEKAPHPYYLHGDHCSNGYFQRNKSVDSLRDSGGEWEIAFERLAVICIIRKTKKDIENGMEARRRNVPQLPNCLTAPSTQYTTKNFGRIRLAFSLSFSDIFGKEWQLSTVFSDPIVSEKENKTIQVDCLNPVEVPKEGGSMLAIHTSTPTTGIQKSDIKIHFIVTNEATGDRTEFVVDVDVVKKHLLHLRTPDLRRTTATVNERQKCSVVVHSHGWKGKELSINFVRDQANSSKGNPGIPPQSGTSLKRARSS